MSAASCRLSLLLPVVGLVLSAPGCFHVGDDDGAAGQAGDSGGKGGKGGSGGASGSGTSASEQIDDLISFSLGDEYATLRERLRVALH